MSIDLAHDLSIDPPERLLEPELLKSVSSRYAQPSSRDRLHLTIDGTPLASRPWSDADRAARAAVDADPRAVRAPGRARAW